jgi:hypothetical protein
MMLCAALAVACLQASVADHLPVVTPFHELAIQQHLTMLLNTDSKLNEAVGAQQEKYKVEMDNLKKNETMEKDAKEAGRRKFQDTRKEIRDNAATCRKAIRKGNKIDNPACVWMGLPLKPPSLKTAAHSSFTKLSALEEELSAHPTFTMLGGKRRRRQSKKKKEEKKVKKDAKKAAKKEKKAQKKQDRKMKQVYCHSEKCHKAQIRIAKRNKKEQAKQQWDKAKAAWDKYHKSLKQAEFKYKHTPTFVKMITPMIQKNMANSKISPSAGPGAGDTVSAAQGAAGFAETVNKTLTIARNFVKYKLQVYFRGFYTQIFAGDGADKKGLTKEIWDLVNIPIQLITNVIRTDLGTVPFVGGILVGAFNALDWVVMGIAHQAYLFEMWRLSNFLRTHTVNFLLNLMFPPGLFKFLDKVIAAGNVTATESSTTSAFNTAMTGKATASQTDASGGKQAMMNTANEDSQQFNQTDTEDKQTENTEDDADEDSDEQFDSD